MGESGHVGAGDHVRPEGGQGHGGGSRNNGGAGGEGNGKRSWPSCVLSLPHSPPWRQRRRRPSAPPSHTCRQGGGDGGDSDSGDTRAAAGPAPRMRLAAPHAL